MIPAPPEGSKPAMVRIMGAVTLSLPFFAAHLFQDGQASFEVFEHGLLSSPSGRPTFTAKITRLQFNSAGKPGVETAIILDDPPVGRDPLPATGAILFRSFRNDANEDARGQRASYIGREIGGQLPANFAHGDEPAARDLPDNRVNQLRLLRSFHFFAPWHAASKFVFHFATPE